MLRNYFKTALRTIFRNRAHALLNVLGLSLGLTCSLVLFLLADYAVSYDDFQENKTRIHRLVSSAQGQGGETDYTPGVPVPLPEAVKQDFPEFEHVTFTRSHYGEMLFTVYPDSPQPQYFELKDERVVFTAPDYFELFTVGWLTGNQVAALEKPQSVVLSKSLADKFFPRSEALGQTVLFNKETSLVVTGIVQDPPANTDMPFHMFISLATLSDEIKQGRWNSIWSDDQCYMLLPEGVSPELYKERLAAFSTKHFVGNDGQARHLSLQPMSDLHFNENYSSYSYKTVSKGQITIMILIGIFLILTACINFVNLSTAIAVKRSREVGVRKVLGGTRNQLVWQFLTESLGVILLSVLISLGLAELLLIYVNPFLQVELSIDLTDPVFLASLIGGSLVITVLAGFYPALVLSGYRPAQALKNQIASRSGGGFVLRRSLVIFQFFISQFFIIGTIVAMSQMHYLTEADLGFRTEALINLRIPEKDPQKKRTLKTELSRIAGVEKVSLLSSNPSSSSVSVSNFSVEDNPEDLYTSMKYVDEDYIEIYGMELLAGRSLRRSDSVIEAVVNEKLLRYMGHAGPYQDAIGKQLKTRGKEGIPIVGVVKDFHSVSLHDEIMTSMLLSDFAAYRLATVKVNLKSFEQTNQQIKAVWKGLYPEFDYQYTFLDETIQKFYESEQKLIKVFSFFSLIAIAIGCLGLFGLASFMVNQKVKEIGVRKVLGASATHIVSMFSLSFFKLIVVAFVFAVPASWFMMKSWLDNFQYRVDLGPLYFIGALIVTLLIAVLTVGYKSVKAAMANPVSSLRSE